MPKKILVSGSRRWPDRLDHLIHSELSGRVSNYDTVLVGDAGGVDRVVLNCNTWGRTCLVFKAKWELYGKRAGPIRNLEMLDQNPDLVLAFWDEESPGTRHVIETALARGIPLRVLTPKAIYA